MASSLPATTSFSFSPLNKKTHLIPPSITHYKLHTTNSPPSLITLQKGTSHFTINPQFLSHPSKLRAPATRNPENTPTNELGVTIFGEKPLKAVLWVLFWTSVSLTIFAFSKDSKASAATVAVIAKDSSIKASSFGVKVATFLRGSGWPDEAIVFALATLPVIELRGAIPVGYWMQLNPLLLTVLSILGNMVPVPFIVLYLKKFATFVAGKNHTASRFLDMLFERAKEKAGPVEEFQWLGLMLFVAVPFPGTGAWTGAIIASVLDMPFWPAVTANFFGVVGAGLLVILLVNLGLKYATITGILLFIVSTFMWSVLRSLKKSLKSAN